MLFRSVSLEAKGRARFGPAGCPGGRHLECNACPVGTRPDHPSHTGITNCSTPDSRLFNPMIKAFCKIAEKKSATWGGLWILSSGVSNKIYVISPSPSVSCQKRLVRSIIKYILLSIFDIGGDSKCPNERFQVNYETPDIN